MELHKIPLPGTRSYQEFVRSRDLSAGVYRLSAGAEDLQTPHAEDEVYFVLAGRSRFTSGEVTVEIEPGACLFVPAHEPHRFHDIAESLELLVVFGPASGSRRQGGNAE